MDFSKAIENNLHNHLFISNYDKESFKDIDLCLGIDEAGRGPVLGPMVYGALFCPVDKEKQLKEMKCADSKSLSEKDRENIFEKINEENKFCGFAVKSLSPNIISTGMLGRVKYNLNELSHDTAISLIDILCNQENLKITHVYLDTVGDPNKYELKLSKRFPKLKIKVSKKADSLYPCVSAASICAKVTRDTLLKNWVFRENCTNKEYGSGYPGDPMTKKFLDSNLNKVFGFVKLVRFSWSTAGLKIKKSCISVKWPDAFDENEDGDDEIVDCTEENDQIIKKETKKSKLKQSKLASAIASDKNNKSILNFFQKPQKRPLPRENLGGDILSGFLLSRKLKLCKNF